MIDDSNPYVPLHNAHVCEESSTRAGCSVFANWAAFYFGATILLLLTAPATSHSNNWSGILPAFCVLMFGAFRLARAGASTSTTFVYGCSTTLLFLFRLLTMGRFSLWLQYQGPSTGGLVIMWIAICLFLGGTAFGIAYITPCVARPTSERPSRRA